MSKLFAIASFAALLLLPALPALASDDGDWVSRGFRAASAHYEDEDSPRAYKYRRATETDHSAHNPKHTTRVARSDDGDDDDGSRPQRHAATKARPHRSLSSDEGGQTGMASFYWEPQALASGGRFNPNALTAAHKTLPFGTRVRVTRVDNGESVDVVINDRGPYIGGRIIDLSRRAAREINMTNAGVARVRVAILGRG